MAFSRWAARQKWAGRVAERLGQVILRSHVDPSRAVASQEKDKAELRANAAIAWPERGSRP